MPSLNTADYIEEALRSVVGQTLRDIEIVCVDAGSIDGTASIIRDFAARDSRVHYVHSDVKSYGYQMNVGLDMASGDYIGIVEPDDFVSLDMYEDLYEIAAENNLDMVKADFYRFTGSESNGNIQMKYNHLSTNDEDYGVVFCPYEYLDSFYFRMNTWSGIYRREFIREHDIRHNETPGASFQDNGFYFQTFAHAKRAMIVKRPYYMNRRDNPNSSIRDAGRIDAFRLEYDFIRDRLKETPGYWDHCKNTHTAKRYINYKAAIQRVELKLKHQYIMQSSEELRSIIELEQIDLEEIPVKLRREMELLINNPNQYFVIVVCRHMAKESFPGKIAHAIKHIPGEIRGGK